MKRKNFTLVEIMIVVAIIGLLAAIAVPSFLKARNNSRAKACINNLRIIEAAKDQYMIDNNTSTAPSALSSYVGQDNYIKTTPVCKAGGSYTVGGATTAPSCGKSADGHTL